MAGFLVTFLLLAGVLYMGWRPYAEFVLFIIGFATVSYWIGTLVTSMKRGK
jgi:hypothetical protein